MSFRLPNTVICTADIDSLKAEGLRYADRLKENGVPTALMVCEGMPHIFFEVGFGEVFRRGTSCPFADAAGAWQKRQCAWGFRKSAFLCGKAF